MHLAVPASFEPREQAYLFSGQLGVGDADLGEAELASPRPDILGEALELDVPGCAAWHGCDAR